MPLIELRSDRAAKVGWKALSTLGGVVGGVATRQVLQAVWPRLAHTSHEPPLNPADRRIGWAEALQWAIAAGVGAGIGRLITERLAAAGWEAATGQAPPGIRT